MQMLRFDDIEVGRTEATVRTVSEDNVNRFARLSGDLNPLHMDEQFAACTQFGRRVAHGMLTAALVSAAHTRLTGPGFVYVGQELKFSAPVFIGDTVTVTLTVVEKKEAKKILVLESTVVKHDGTTVLSGSSALKELVFTKRPPGADGGN